MRYEAPAVEGRFELSAELGIAVSGTRQPVWRTEPAEPQQD